MIRSRKTAAIPPGESIKEQLEYRGMSLREFSCRMDMSKKLSIKLLNGDIPINIDIAKRLERVLGVPKSFWINLEKIYKEDLAKVIGENEADAKITYFLRCCLSMFSAKIRLYKN